MLIAGVACLALAGLLWSIAPMGGDMNRALFGEHAVRTGSAGRERGQRGLGFVLLSIAVTVAGVVCLMGAAIRALQ